MESIRIRGRNCQVSGTGKQPAGLSLIARSMFIPAVQPISIRKAPAGRALIHKMRSCLAWKGIAKVARFLSFILLQKLIFIQKFPRKTLHRTKRQNIPLLSFIRNLLYSWAIPNYGLEKAFYVINHCTSLWCFSVSELSLQFYLGEKRRQCNLFFWVLSTSCSSYPVLQRWFIRSYGFDL